MQVAGRYILGAADTKSFEHFGKDSSYVDSYFLLDTQTGERTQFQNYDALRTFATQLNVEPNLQPIYEVYSHYRFSWFDVFAGLLFCAAPIAGAFVLIRWIVRSRGSRSSFPQTA